MSFFKTLKSSASISSATQPAEARLDIVDWIEGFYNKTALGLVDRVANLDNRRIQLLWLLVCCTSNRGKVTNLCGPSLQLIADISQHLVALRFGKH